jgi:DNA-binding NarL/FixJ family response regulator
MVAGSFQAGAKGVFSRDQSVESLAKCIEMVHEGQIWARTNELQIILQTISKRSHFKRTTATRVRSLTSRENEVALRVAEGLHNNEISERMKLSENTVRNYLQNVYKKLGISSRIELMTRVRDGRAVAFTSIP